LRPNFCEQLHGHGRAGTTGTRATGPGEGLAVVVGVDVVRMN
jgi:hypothetical protein